MRTPKNSSVLILSIVAGFSLGGLLFADEYPRAVQVSPESFPYEVPNHDGKVEVLLMEGGGFQASTGDLILRAAINAQLKGCNKSKNFRIYAVASWPEERLAFVVQTACGGGSDHWSLVRHQDQTDIASVKWSGFLPSAPTMISFQTIAEGPDRGLISIQSTPWHESGRQVHIIDFQGNDHGLFGAERFLGPISKTDGEALVLVASRFVTGADCPANVNDELIENNESLITSCHIQEFLPVVFWASGCSQLAPTKSVAGCSGRYCSPLPGETTPDEVIPQFNSISELPRGCEFWTH